MFESDVGMKYKTLAGVILTSVCGHNYLVSSKDTIEINETAVLYWQYLNKGASEEELTKLAAAQYGTEDLEILQNDIQTFLALLKERHMIMRCGGE